MNKYVTITCIYRSGRNRFVFKKSDCLLSLGVADNQSVPDNRISASSSLPGYPANEARLNSARGWCAAKKDKNQFVQIDLGKVRMNFTHSRVEIFPNLILEEKFGYADGKLSSFKLIEFQAKKVSAILQRGTDTGDVTAFSLQYSLDGQRWTVWSSKPRTSVSVYYSVVLQKADIHKL